MVDLPRESGFTIVEVLVTLVLMSMVAAIVFGSLRQVIEARTRLRPYLDQSEQTTLAAGWFRQTVQGLMADYVNGKHRFTAKPEEFAGLTVSPLAGTPGTPTAFHWSLIYDDTRDVTVLEYNEPGAGPMRVASWAGRQGAFSYYGLDQEWHTRWSPPDTLDKSQSVPQLPQLIRLGGVPRDLFPMIIARPRGSQFPRPLPLNLVGGVLSAR